MVVDPHSDDVADTVDARSGHVSERGLHTTLTGWFLRDERAEDLDALAALLVTIDASWGEHP
jgi:hypothetical protein